MVATLGQRIVRTTGHIKAIKVVDKTKQLPAVNETKFGGISVL